MRSCSIKHGMPSVIFSLEMSKSEIVMRLLSAETNQTGRHALRPAQDETGPGWRDGW